MAANSFGSIFKITTWGESHGKALGVVIDGCPAGLELNDEDINLELEKRAPGKSPFTSPRTEKDLGEILSGVFEGKTTGAPLCIIIYNKDADSSKYTPIKDLMRPGHANFTYLEKYGIFDYRGGGRSSARETVARVAAGAVAKKLLNHFKIEVCAYMKEIGGINANIPFLPLSEIAQKTYSSPVHCPDPAAEEKIMKVLEDAMKEGDSLGGVIELISSELPLGLGDPIYGKLEALLASAMLSIPATKGFEIGSGFKAAAMKGSAHNDTFEFTDGKIKPKSNLAGGTLGGITTSAPLLIRVAFKPTSSIQKVQPTVNAKGELKHFELPEGSRHDPCVAIRAVAIVEAMTRLVLADTILLNRCAKI